MTSSSILPSIGPPPPEFRRPQVPESLRPQLAGESAEEGARPVPPAPIVTSKAEVAPAQGEASGKQLPTDAAAPARTRSQAPPSTNLGGGSAVSLQVKESAPRAENKLETGLTDEEKAAVANLKERDREVRAHENAHASVGGGFTGAPNYEFTRGPDGVQYAVGGQVDIDISEVVGDPRATIAKLEIVRSAALAPARPSGQDRAVAAAAAAKTQEARAELAVEEEETREAKAAGDGAQADGPLSVSQSVAGAATEGADEEGSFNQASPSAQPSVFSAATTGGITSQPTISIDLLV